MRMDFSYDAWGQCQSNEAQPYMNTNRNQKSIPYIFIQMIETIKGIRIDYFHI